MDIYLVRHGQAMAGADDSARALSPTGVEESEEVARKVRDLGARPARILHSGKLRAHQTANIFARELEPAGGLQQISGLAPNDDPAIAADLLASSADSLMLVGHLPHMASLAALLLRQTPESSPILFGTSTAVCLSRSDSGWQLKWTCQPAT